MRNVLRHVNEMPEMVVCRRVRFGATANLGILTSLADANLNGRAGPSHVPGHIPRCLLTQTGNQVKLLGEKIASQTLIDSRDIAYVLESCRVSRLAHVVPVKRTVQSSERDLLDRVSVVI